MLDEGPWLQGKEAGLWETLDPAKIPNLRDVPAQFGDRDGKGTPLMLVMLGLMYEEAALKANNIPAPTSFYDLWSPAFRNRVSIQQFSSTFAFALLAHTTRIEGGDVDKSFDPGFAKLRELRPNVRTFSGPAAQLIQLFQQKEIWLAWGGHFTAMQAAAAGVPVRWVAPKEGAMGYAHFMAIARGAPGLPDAERLVNLMLSPEYQKAMAETDFMGPANPKTRLNPEFAKTFPVTVQGRRTIAIAWR
jgi:putative spermidine/putrescine transport system substrate-binding protein